LDKRIERILWIQDLEAAIRKTLDRIRKRDGARIRREAATYLQDAANI